MAVIEQNGIMKFLDENGNIYLCFPITKKENVEGLDDIEANITALLARKINGKALSEDITLSAEDVGAVPTTRKVNEKELSSDISLSYSDVNAAPAYTYGTADKTAGSSALETGTLYFVYE